MTSLSETHLRLLDRGARSQSIPLSDDSAFRTTELIALIELEREGLVAKGENALNSSPPLPRPWVITDAGRQALANARGAA